MVEIPLTQGLYTLISPQDETAVRAYRWYAHRAGGKVYAASNVNGRSLYLHRFLLGVKERFTFVDHIDRNGLNNIRSNLRIADPALNLANSKARVRRHGRPGVWEKDGRWYSRVVSKGVSYYLGTFASEHEAGIAFDAAYLVLYGFKHS